MSLGKKGISKSISTKTDISLDISEKLLNSFLEILKKETLNKSLKISKFGTFDRKLSPARIGRNPKSKKEFIIIKRSKLTFKSSNNVKSILN